MRRYPLDSISPNPMQPRRRFNEESLQELAESLKEHGLVQPIIVRPIGYRIRDPGWRAQVESGPAGGSEVHPGRNKGSRVSRSASRSLWSRTCTAMTSTESKRRPPTVSSIEDFGLSQDEMAVKVAKSRSAVANALRLLQLPVEVQATVVAEEITPGHARALLALQGDPYQAVLLQRIIEEELSVRQTEELARRRLGGGEEQVKREKPQSLDEFADLIAASLQAKVRVIQGKRKGKIIIEFKGEKDLMRLLKDIGVSAQEADL
jgi:ParB family transcriptional regulator, chromosome partitioning protein